MCEIGTEKVQREGKGNERKKNVDILRGDFTFVCCDKRNKNRGWIGYPVYFLVSSKSCAFWNNMAMV